MLGDAPRSMDTLSGAISLVVTDRVNEYPVLALRASVPASEELPASPPTSDTSPDELSTPQLAANDTESDVLPPNCTEQADDEVEDDDEQPAKLNRLELKMKNAFRIECVIAVRVQSK
jgi:hypothetical protein